MTKSTTVGTTRSISPSGFPFPECSTQPALTGRATPSRQLIWGRQLGSIRQPRDPGVGIVPNSCPSPRGELRHPGNLSGGGSLARYVSRGTQALGLSQTPVPLLTGRATPSRQLIRGRQLGSIRQPRDPGVGIVPRPVPSPRGLATPFVHRNWRWGAFVKHRPI